MKKFVILMALLFMVTVFVSCAAHEYTMGSGPEKGFKTTKQQWYILYGLIPLNNVDVTKMIGDAQNYEVRTAQEPMDVVINIFTSYVTVTSRTVTVTK